MKKGLFMCMVLTLTLVSAACGGNGNDAEGVNEGGASQEITLIATNWDFDQDTYQVEPGEVEIHLENEEGYHGIEIEGTDISIDGDGSATATLEAGEYKVICSIPCGEGHDEMVATIIVE